MRGSMARAGSGGGAGRREGADDLRYAVIGLCLSHLTELFLHITHCVSCLYISRSSTLSTNSPSYSLPTHLSIFTYTPTHSLPTHPLTLYLFTLSLFTCSPSHSLPTHPLTLYLHTLSLLL